MTCVTRTVEVECQPTVAAQTKGAIGGDGLSVETAIEFLPDELSVEQVATIAAKLCEVTTAVEALKACLSPPNKLDATTDPTVNDDGVGTAGNGAFEVGSIWRNTSTDEVFRCADASTGAAVWISTGTSIDDLGVLATLDSVGLAHVDAPVLARSNHTGTQSSSTISDLAATISSHPVVSANEAARHSHANKLVLDAISNAGSGVIISAAERLKLAGISDGATANSADAALLSRANHTGTQAASTIADFAAAVAAVAAVAANTAARHTHANGSVLDALSDAGSGAVITAVERSKLAGIAGGATANSPDATLLARANHTGTQPASTISDFDAEVANNTTVAANTSARHTHGNIAVLNALTNAGSGAVITAAERAKLAGLIGYTPAMFGAAGNGTTNDDAEFAALEAEVQGQVIDCGGKSYLVTSIPTANKYVNGYWRYTNYDEGAEIDLPMRDTLETYELQIHGGRLSCSWPQDKASSYNGVAYFPFLTSYGHAPGSRGMHIATSINGGHSIQRYEQTRMGEVGDLHCFAMTTVPPSTSGGSYDGAWQLAISQSGGLMYAFRRALAEYEQDSSGGGLDQAETPWSQVPVDGVSFGAALRAATDSAYGVTTSGLPTLIHSLSLYGGPSGAPGGGGNCYFGFHGLSGATGPHIGEIGGTPKDGAANMGFIGRIGLLTEGVEPTVAWYAKDGVSTRLCGFIRSQSSGYPVRFWHDAAASQAGVEGATIEDCPFGNDFATYSPIPCRFRPRRRGAVSGWITTWETYGDSGDELWFCFTGKRVRNGGPGNVGLYVGYCRQADFDTFWTSAKIIGLTNLYFANFNTNDTSNQVGVPSMTWSDSNTLHVLASTEHPAVQGEHDSAYLRVITIKLRDNYADASEERAYDDKTTHPVYSEKIPDHTAFDEVWIDDDSVAYVHPPHFAGLAWIMLGANHPAYPGEGWSGLFAYDVGSGSPVFRLVNGSGNFNLYNTALVGNSGTDTDINVGGNVPGAITIENRSGAGGYFTVRWLG